MTQRILAFAASMILLCLFFLWRSWRLPSADEVSTLIGPRLWPMAILIVMALLLALLLVRTALRRPSVASSPASSRKDPSEPLEGVGRRGVAARARAAFAGNRHVVVLALTIAYTLLMNMIGFVAATALFALAGAVVLGESRLRNLAAATVAATLLVAIVFDMLLEIPLP